MTETPQWVSLSLDPGTAEYLGLPPRLQVPVAALESVEQGLSVGRLADALHRAAELHPPVADDPGVQRFLSRSDQLDRLENYLRVGNLTFAGQIAKDLSRADSRDPLALGTLGRVALQEGRWKQALVHFEEALKAAPSHAPTQLEQALALAGSGNASAALESIRRLESHRTVGFLARVWRWELEHAHFDRMGQRLEFLRRILQQAENDDDDAAELEQLFPGNPEARFLTAVHPSWKEPEAARIAALKSVLRDAPGHVQARVLLAHLLRRAGETAPALSVLEEAPEPRDPHILAARGAALEQLGRMDEARDAYRRIFERSLAEVEHGPLIQAGQGLLRVGRPEETRVLLQDAADLRPKDSLPRQMLARLDEMQGDSAAAERRLRDAQRECGQTPGLAYALGDFLRRAGRDAEAVGIFKALIHREPALPWGYRGLGDMSLKTQPQKAVEHYAQALTLDPATPIPGYDYLRGVAALRAGNLDEANAWLARAVAGEPDNPRYWGDLGAAHFYQGRVDQAVQATERAAALDPENPGFAHNLSQFHGRRFRDRPLSHWRSFFKARRYAAKARKLARASRDWEKDLWTGGSGDAVGSPPAMD